MLQSFCLVHDDETSLPRPGLSREIHYIIIYLKKLHVSSWFWIAAHCAGILVYITIYTAFDEPISLITAQKPWSSGTPFSMLEQKQLANTIDIPVSYHSTSVSLFEVRQYIRLKMTS